MESFRKFTLLLLRVLLTSFFAVCTLISYLFTMEKIGLLEQLACFIIGTFSLLLSIYFITRD